MNKILSAIIAIFSLVLVSTASNAQVSIGFSGVAGWYSADGTEKESDETTRRNEELLVGYASIFAEYGVTDQIAIGFDIIPYSVESEESSRTDVVSLSSHDETAGSTNDSGTSTVKVSMNNHMTLYAKLGGESGAYAKLGAHYVEVESLENLHTGSSYGNEEIYGGYVGLGYQADLPNAESFFRVELGYSSYEEINKTASGNGANSISVDLEGATARISLGKSF